MKTLGGANRGETVVLQNLAEAGRGGVREDLMGTVAVEKKTGHEGWR